MPLGTVGGLHVGYHFPLDGEYAFQAKLYRTNLNIVRGLEAPYEFEFAVDGRRILVATVIDHLRRGNGRFQFAREHPLPLVAVGGGAGAGHRHVVLPTRTPVGSLWMSVAAKFGREMDRFGDATEKADVFA